MINKLDIFAKGRPYISPSQAGLLTGNSACPARWSFKYEHDIEIAVKPLAMRRGSFFDSLLDWPKDMPDGWWSDEFRSQANAQANLEDADIDIILQRYKEYLPMRPAGMSQVAIEIDLDYKDYWVRGFVDILPDDLSLPFIEIKLPGVAWERKKLAYNRMQIITYAQAVGRPGEFHVSNMAEPGVQVFGEKDYLPRGKDQSQSWIALRKSYIKGIKLIESDDRAPRPNVLCKGQTEHSTWQCDYYDLCQAEIKAKEMRIDELSKVF